MLAGQQMTYISARFRTHFLASLLLVPEVELLRCPSSTDLFLKLKVSMVGTRVQVC